MSLQHVIRQHAHTHIHTVNNHTKQEIQGLRLRRWHVTTYLVQCMCVCVCLIGGVCNTLNIFSAVSLHLLELTDKSLHL